MLRRIPKQVARIPKTLKRIPKTISKALAALSDVLSSALGLPLVVQVALASAVVALGVGIATAVANLTLAVQQVSLPFVGVTVPVSIVTWSVGRYSVPVYVLAVVLTWPVVATVTGAALWWTRADHPVYDRLVGGVLIRTGLLQRERLLDKGLAALIGLVGTLVGAGLVLGAHTVFGFDFDRSLVLVASVFAWPAGTFVVLVVLWQRTNNVSSDAVAVVGFDNRDDGMYELTLRNEVDFPITLSKAKLRDGTGRHYLLRGPATLRPGNTAVFALPAEFRLDSPTTSIWLPLGFEIERGRTTATIVTRTGGVYVLDWNEFTTDRDAESRHRDRVSTPLAEPESPRQPV